MGSYEFGWESLLHTDAPPLCSLKAALFTTYDRADERFLAEHLLPFFLKISREPDGEGTERQYFLLELDNRLKVLHDRIVIVSSTVHEEPPDTDVSEIGTYGWIWRSIRHLTVGRNGKAVQHAKLWLLHWGAAEAGGFEYLEIVISSANLTRAAFKGQLQAAWRTCIEVHPLASQKRLRDWGILPEFLRDLAASAGEDGRFAPFVELLARSDRPKGVTFVASVPGKHSRQTLQHAPWGVAGLRTMLPSGKGPVKVAILAPFVGSWSTDALKRWCARFEGSPDRLSLVWIDKNHPWARGGKWWLPVATFSALTELNARILTLRHDLEYLDNNDPFHQEHHPADDRWSHAKVYLLSRGNSRRLLVTSANFSEAAWGTQTDDGQFTIENFELGVCVDQAVWPFDGLDLFADEQDVATVQMLPSRSNIRIMWARAVWDGKKVDVDCRCESNGELLGVIQSGDEWTLVPSWKINANDCLRSAQIPWEDSTRPPSIIQLSYERETVNIPVFDERPLRNRENSIPPEVDENMAQMMRDELLFEQYGGRVAGEADEDKLTNSEDRLNDEDDADDEVGTVRSDIYSVPAFVSARQHLAIVDNWADKVKCIGTRGVAEFDRTLLQRDGDLLIKAFKRQADRDRKKGAEWAIGANLAADEMRLRLNHFQEG